MNRSITQVASVILSGAMDLTAMSVMASQALTEYKVAITVHAYNYARIPAWRLARTQRRVADYFLSAGIQLQWVDHPMTSTNGPDPAGPAWKTGDLVLKIVANYPKKAQGFRDSVFGFAAGIQVTIINERTEEIAEVAEATYPEILAIVIAHELGHVLLGPDSHSDTGIMRPRFQADDFGKAQCKTLAFTPQQAEQMRRRVGELMSYRRTRAPSRGIWEVITLRRGRVPYARDNFPDRDFAGVFYRAAILNGFDSLIRRSTLG